MKPKNLTDFIDKTLNNIYKIDFPYSYLNFSDGHVKGKQVVFFGFDFKSIANLDKTEFVKRMNLCLDYVRRQCRGYELYYKPHPNETDEYKNYNLELFKILDKRESAEIYLLNNLKKIDCIFAVISVAALSAYKLGIDSYIFYKIFENIFDNNARLYFNLAFGKMPKSFFIDDLNKNLVRPGKTYRSENNSALKNLFKKLIFNPQKQKAWITVNHPRFLLEIISLANLLKKELRVGAVNLIVSKHWRWENIDAAYLKSYFDNIYFFPRYVYSLRPKNLLGFLKTLVRVKKLDIDKNDLIINFSPCEFIENMVISSFGNCKKINFAPENEYRQNADRKIFKKNEISFNKATFIFNKIIEPILGMNKSMYLIIGKGGDPNEFVRYEKPLNRIYDHVFLYKID